MQKPVTPEDMKSDGPLRTASGSSPQPLGKVSTKFGAFPTKAGNLVVMPSRPLLPAASAGIGDQAQLTQPENDRDFIPGSLHLIEVGTETEKREGKQKYFCLTHKRIINPEWIQDGDKIIPSCEDCCMDDMEREGLEFGDLAEMIEPERKAETGEDVLDGIISEAVGEGLEHERYDA